MTQKPYKCRVEYLESSGTQYIDTGIKGKNNIDFDYKAVFTNVTTSSGYGIGGEWQSGNSLYLGLIRSNGTFAYHYGNTASPVVVLNSVSSNTPYVIKGHMWTGEQYMVINGTKSSVGTVSGTFTATENIALFRVSSASPIYSYAKIYYLKIWDNGVLVRDMIPVLDNSGRPAMYDQVSGQLFYNKDSGDDFTYGRQIIPVEYIESTGTQYIDTGIKLNNNSSVEIDYQLTQAVQNRKGLFGGLDTGGSKRFGALVSPSNNQLEGGYGSGNEFYQLGLPDTNRHIIKQAKNLLYFDGSLVYTFNTATFTQSFNAPLGNFNYTNYNPASAKYYSCKIYDNDTLVRDFIPCIDENLVPFMFDKVHNTAYLNAGAGQFKVGPYKADNFNKKLLRKKLALMLATFKKKRKYYCEVEYIESTGTQYIDTGFKMSNDNMTFDGNIMWTDKNATANFFFGYRLANSPVVTGDMRTFFVYGASVSPIGKLAIRYGVNADNSTQAISLNTKYNISWDGSNLKINGTIYDTLSQAYTPASYKSMFLFWCNCENTYSADVGKFVGRIYNWKIKQDGVLVRDFIPVLDWNMTPCMYDKVTDQLFYNQGSGTFQYGREIHQVEYIETDGTSYINTGYIPSGSTETEITTMLKDQTNSRFMFGCRSSQSNKTYACLAHNQNRIGYRVGDGSYLYSNGYNELNEKHTYKIANGVFYRDDVVINTACQGATVSPNSPLSLLTINTNNVLDITQPFIGNLYSCTIKDNNVLVRDYIPAIDENGVGFMFDRVSHTIYDNAGTGTFGYSAREVEYLQSDGARAIVAGVTVDDTCGYDVKWMALNSNDTIIMGTKGSGDSRWVLSGNNNPNVNISWNTSSGGIGLGLNKIQTAQMNYLNDRKRFLNDIPLADITATLSSSASTYNVGIFGGYWGSATIGLYSTCRIYYAKISKGTELIRDFIPMFKDGSPCLFDKIGGEYYFGTGTGTFTTGKIVEPEYE